MDLLQDIQRICTGHRGLRYIRIVRHSDVSQLPPLQLINQDTGIQLRPNSHVANVNGAPSQLRAIATERLIYPGAHAITLDFQAHNYSSINTINLRRMKNQFVHAEFADFEGSTLWAQFLRFSYVFEYSGKVRTGYRITLSGTTNQIATFSGTLQENNPVPGGLINLAGAQLIDLSGQPLVALAT